MFVDAMNPFTRSFNLKDLDAKTLIAKMHEDETSEETESESESSGEEVKKSKKKKDEKMYMRNKGGEVLCVE